jgi:hypothetical protein
VRLQWRRRWRSGRRGVEQRRRWTFRRWQRRPLDRLGFRVRDGWANLVPWARGPHSLLYGTVRRGPTNLVGLDAPDQGADQGPSQPLGLTRRRSILTIPTSSRTRRGSFAEFLTVWYFGFTNTKFLGFIIQSSWHFGILVSQIPISSRMCRGGFAGWVVGLSVGVGEGSPAAHRWCRRVEGWSWRRAQEMKLPTLRCIRK